ncbi:MAG: hypothetical protein IKN46_01165 [Acholeplasmatales bacterium]|nr:hypothetical protein [Acholeplasmatales bacterium]
MLKTYARKYVKSYAYKNPDTGEEERLDFLVSAELFPLFKSYTGVELGTALNEYRRELLNIVNQETVEAVAKFDTADNEDKLNILIENKEVFDKIYVTAENSDSVNGFSLIEALLITTRALALPKDDRANALAAGLELLPEEVFNSPEFAFSILESAVSYDNFVKKNSIYQK